MKAVLARQYGEHDILELQDVDKPTPADNQVLVVVHAVSLNPKDWHRMTGTPAMVRQHFGNPTPNNPRIGSDFAGTVQAIGSAVTKFKVGDEVFGVGFGAFAEYECTNEKNLALKPADISFKQASAVPVAAITALQGLRDNAQVKEGQKVLINGASGGVGSFAVQLAKIFGAHVTGVCSSGNIELVRSIGTDEVIDYTQDDFTENANHYDVILDTVGNHSISEYQRCLREDGICVLVGSNPELREELQAYQVPETGRKIISMFAMIKADDLAILAEYMASDQLEPLIDTVYELSQIADAMQHLSTKRARGKIIVEIVGR